jgi:plasmid stabilization system protein ParE
MNYSVAPLVLDDLDEIYAYVEDIKGEDAANLVIDDLYDAFAKISSSPDMGHRRQDLTDYDVFFWTALKRFAVVYRKTSPIAIVRVIPWPRMEPVLLTPAGGLWV